MLECRGINLVQNRTHKQLIMITLFYLAVLSCIIIEIVQLSETKRIVNSLYRYKEDKKTSTNLAIYTCACLYYWTISFIGLLSFQWYLFLLIIIMGLIPKGKNIWIRKFDSIASVIILLFIVLNKYHFHINIL